MDTMGKVTLPGCSVETNLSRLSDWNDGVSVYAFTYAKFYVAALNKRDDWFGKWDWSSHISWWIHNDEIPTRAEGSKRLEHLHDNGSTAHAFDFKKPLYAQGRP